MAWRVQDLIGGDKQLDFNRRFLPESLARVEELDFMSPDEQRVLNQIRGHESLRMFVNIEAFVGPFVLDAGLDLHRLGHGAPALPGQHRAVVARHSGPGGGGGGGVVPLRGCRPAGGCPRRTKA